MDTIDFPGGKYLLEELPDYDNERQMLVVKFVLTFLFWTILVPFLLMTEKTVSTTGEGSDTSDLSLIENAMSTTTTTKSSSTTRRRTTSTTKVVKVQQSRKKKVFNTKKETGIDNKNKIKILKETNLRSTQAAFIACSKSGNTIKVVDGFTNIFCCVGCILHIICVLLLSSPDNYYATRTVFEAPLFYQEECNHLIGIAERVAEENYRMAQNFFQEDTGEIEQSTYSSIHKTMTGYLQKPFGWQKTRHNFHRTTDLNLVTDNFSDKDRAWIKQRLDARLAPTLERIFGVPPSAIRANDIFLVRYDGDRQASLSRHTDDGSITFSTLLSYGFEGGGTRYWNRDLGVPFTYVLPKAGMMTTFPAMIQHEGVETTKGRRYLLIGFLAVDKINPWTRRSTDLTWFSSWGSFNWASTKFKEGVKAAFMEKGMGSGQSNDGHFLYSDQAGQLFAFVHKLLIGICDVIFTHRFVVLVNETSADDYLHDLDEAYTLKTDSISQSQQSYNQRSSWFAGQQISLNIDGSFRRNWSTRQDSDKKFGSLN